ncbi:hypothetical protein R5O24_09940 [Tenacibaculum maritimum]|uniref:hypothetical protein n=1 Tax=Tenacibaculum maritimum TaxID=107401 RepID=UPI00389012D4
MNTYNFFIIGTLFLATVNSFSQKQAFKNIPQIFYHASTRGYSKELQVKRNIFFYKEDKKELSYNLRNKDLKKIQKIINSIDLKKIKEFTTTSKKRFSDRALQATISITINDITYNALPFDQEHPPKELTPLILLLKGFIK